jgi:hypothetical protein
MTERKPKRSPQEIVAAKQAELDAAIARAALKDAENLPEIQALTNTLADIKAEKLVAKRKFSGPQSFSKRLAKHCAWMSEIEAAEALATALVEGFEDQENYLKAQITALIRAYTKGDYDQEALEVAADKAVNDMPTFSEDVTLVKNYNDARAARVALTAKASKEDKENEVEA